MYIQSLNSPGQSGHTGVIPAVFQVTNNIILELLASALITLFVMYLILNEERIKVK